MADEYNLLDCFERCGSCSYVCPAHIPWCSAFAPPRLVRKAAGRAMRNAAHPGNPQLAAPGQRRGVDVIMRNVVLALLPVAAFAIYSFGGGPGACWRWRCCPVSPPNICCAGWRRRPPRCATGR